MFDPADPAFLDDPYPAFDAARSQGSVQWHDGLGVFVALGRAACDEVLRERGAGRIWHDREPTDELTTFNLLHQVSMLENEPPAHTRLRRLVSGAFGRGHVERLRPWVASLADDLVSAVVARIADGEAVDLISEVARPLPVEVIAELLGVPAADRHRLGPWSNTIVRMYEPGAGPDVRAAAETASVEFVGYLRGLVDERRDDPPADLLGDLLATVDADGARLHDDEIIGTCVLLLMAGHEATVNVVGNGTLALLERPEEWSRLRGDRSLVPSAAEEMIRFDSPLQLFERTAVVDLEVGGVPVPAGAKVAALLGAANRDPATFERPDVFDAGRDPNPHLGFGAGIHFCLGAPLARIEIQAVLDALVRHLPPGTEVVDAVRHRRFVMRGLDSLTTAFP